LLVVAALTSLGVSGAYGDPLPALAHHGRWLTDPQGRVVILHGVQVDKFKPGTSIEGWSDLSPLAAPFIGEQGFNLVRDSINYAAVEPQLGAFDDSYIERYFVFDHQLADAGIYDLVNMMQGQYNGQLGPGASGFPDWMTITNGFPNIPRPFPQAYLVNPAEERAWDNFWANARARDGVGLQDHYARGLVHIDRLFSSQPAFLGIDLLNEPWPGLQWPTCANPLGCPLFDRELNAFYRRIVPALRNADPQRLVFYEPHGLFDFGSASNIGPIGDPRAVFTFHNYCLGDIPGLPQADPGHNCGIEEQLVLGEAETQAAREGDGLLEDEWGNTTSVPLLERMTSEADQHRVGWSYWAYEDCCGSPGAIVRDATIDPLAPGNLNLPVLEALVRPYPQLISGTPTSWSFDTTSKVFALRYSTQRVSGGRFAANSPTEVFIPRLQYPHGYDVTVTGARIASSPTAGALVLCSSAGAASVSVTVTPAATSTTDVPPGPGQAAACP
jgi:endoglycosylceramidase